MFAVVATRESRRIPVLLGGSGLAGCPPVPHRKLPVLLCPVTCTDKCTRRPCADCHVPE